MRYAVTIINSGDLPATGLSYRGNISPLLAADPTLVSTSLGTIEMPNVANPSIIQINLGDLNGGDSEITLHYDLTIANPLPDTVSEIEHFGTVRSDELPNRVTDDPALPGRLDATVLSVTAAPLVRLAMNDYLLVDTDENQAVSSGDILLYIINVTNVGNAPARNITVEDLTSKNIALVPGSVTSVDGVVTKGNGTDDSKVVVEIATLPGGGGDLTISYQAKVVDELEGERILNQVASIAQDPIDLSAQSIIMSDDPDTAEAFDSTVTNIAPGAPVQTIYQTNLPIIER